MGSKAWAIVLAAVLAALPFLLSPNEGFLAPETISFPVCLPWLLACSNCAFHPVGLASGAFKWCSPEFPLLPNSGWEKLSNLVIPLPELSCSSKWPPSFKAPC